MTLFELIDQLAGVFPGNVPHCQEAEGQLLVQLEPHSGADRVAFRIGNLVHRPIEVLDHLPNSYQRDENLEEPGLLYVCSPSIEDDHEQAGRGRRLL